MFTLEMFKNLVMVLFGLSLLIFAINNIGSCIKPFISKDKLASFLKKYTNNRFIGCLVGFICTVILQSAGAATMIILNFVDEGVLSASSAMAFILGSSVGTTIKSFFSYLDQIKLLGELGTIVMFITFFAVISMSMIKNKKMKEVIKLMFIFSLFFAGPKITKIFFKKFEKTFSGLVEFLNNWPFVGLLIGFSFGAIFCSSSSLTAVIQVSYDIVPGLSLYSVLPLIFGVNIGSTIPTFLASLNNQVATKRVAFFKLLSKLVSTIPSILITVIFKSKLSNINKFSKIQPGLQIAISHLLFNTLSVIIFLPILPYVIKFMEKIIKDKNNVINQQGEKKIL